MTIELGKMNDLKLVRLDEKGGFLDAETYGEVFLPLSQLPPNPELGILVTVFCYIDDDRLTVTAKRPRALIGELARMTCKSALKGAAYLEWGIRKDLMVPFIEQRIPMKEGREYVVYVTMDRAQRLYGTTKFNKYISDEIPKNTSLKEGDACDIIAVAKTPLGIKVVVNNSFYAMLMHGSSVDTAELRMGVKTRGYILTIRKDRKVNVGLHKNGMAGVQNAGAMILDKLKANGGFLPFGDHSDPRAIEHYFGMSKSKFKKAIGGLYREQVIEITDDGVRLTEE